MTDFASTDLVSVASSGSTLGGVSTDLLWFFGAPITPPTGAVSPHPIQAVTCDLGRDELARLLGDHLGELGGGPVAYFKFGEGGWSPGLAFTEQTVLSPGGTVVASQVTRSPVFSGSLTVAVGAQSVTDDGAGGFTGDGTGTVNYKTGAFSITFDAITVGGTPVMATYRSWGHESDRVEEDWATGGSGAGAGPFVGTLSAFPVVPGTVSVWDGYDQYLVDDGAGGFTGDGTGTIDYETGAISVTFTSDVRAGFPVRSSWLYFLKPKSPSRGRADLEAVGDGLFSISKALELTDMVFQGAGTGTVRITCELAASEGNDDGSGEAPVYYEGGIYTSTGVLVAYVTWPGVKKTSSGALTRVIDLVV